MKLLSGIILMIAALHLAADDQRPRFDKSGHLNTVWSQANPWWLPKFVPPDRKGGPDYAWHTYPEEDIAMWKKVAEVCRAYGMTGLQLEVTLLKDATVNWEKTLESVASGFQAAGNGFKVMPFLSIHKAANEAAAIAQLDNYLAKVWELLSTHPNVHRLDNAPVLVIYTVNNYPPELWTKIFAHAEKKYGKMIFLGNFWLPNLRTDASLMRKYLEVFDGISVYANYNLKSQVDFHDLLVPLIKRDFADKILEISPHNTYTVHFSYGGTKPDLNEKYLASWKDVVARQPDSVVLTNFFDIYENSRILPSYELDDSLLAIAQYYIAQWRKKPYRSENKLNFYFSNFVWSYLGDDLLFELIALPAKVPEKLQTTLELYSPKGELLHSFPPKSIDAMTLERTLWKIPAWTFKKDFAVLPRLKIQTPTQTVVSDFFPPTMLTPSLRPHLLWFSRSLDNMLQINSGEKTWELSGANNGETLAYPADGIGFIRANFASNSHGAFNQGGGTVRLLRNGMELRRFRRWSANITESVDLPNPGAALDWYQLELVNANSARYLSPPIWVTGSRGGETVHVPIVKNNGEIEEMEVAAAQIPFFYYPCNMDSGSLLIDRSGYSHNGFGGGTGYGGGHLDRTGYRHEHNGGLLGTLYAGSPAFRREAEGGFYRFSGKEYFTIQGGTLPPYSMTVELSIRPEKTDQTAGIVGSGNNAVQLSIRPDGYLLLSRSNNDGKNELLVQSARPLEFGKWHKIAISYDAKTLRLFVDRQEVACGEIPPSSRHLEFNAFIIGAKCRNYHRPVDFFHGDIKQIRLYGRNLSLADML